MSGRAHIVVGLGYGDEGKGTVVDALVRETGARIVVRFNGGAQAGHNVVTPAGDHHCFSSWGSGTLAGAQTILTRDVVLTPLAMIEEAKHLRELGIANPFGLVLADDACFVTTPAHAQLGQVRELWREHGEGRHGSCGVGIGELMREMDRGDVDPDAEITAADLRDYRALGWKIRAGRQRALRRALALWHSVGNPPDMVDAIERLRTDFDDVVVASMHEVGQAISIASSADLQICVRGKDVVFEGAQGVLLDEWRGFHPHTTWSTTTPDNALAFLFHAEYGGEVRRIGVTRWYATRHGAGPMPTEIPGAEAPPTEHNRRHPWQGSFRLGWFDAVATRYAIDSAGGIDALAVTCLDHRRPLRAAVAYQSDDGRVRKLKATKNIDLKNQQALGRFLGGVVPVIQPISSPEAVVELLRVPVEVLSYGPAAADKKWAPARASASA